MTGHGFEVEKGSQACTSIAYCDGRLAGRLEISMMGPYRFRKFSFPPGEKPYLLPPGPVANRMAFDAYIERLHVLHKLTRILIRAESADAAESVLGIVQFPLLLIL
jgi:hypothetical protein